MKNLDVYLEGKLIDTISAETEEKCLEIAEEKYGEENQDDILLQFQGQKEP